MQWARERENTSFWNDNWKHIVRIVFFHIDPILYLAEVYTKGRKSDGSELGDWDHSYGF